MLTKTINKIVFFTLCCFLFVNQLNAADIKGHVQINENWQPVLYLASIRTPENLNVASPDFIISKTLINPDGSFHFENLILPDDPQFYRFYLVRNAYSGVEFNLQGDRNFIHFILNNTSDLSFEADITQNSLVISEVNGDQQNSELLTFDKIYWEKKGQLNTNLSKAQREFLNLEIENYIRTFVDSCSNTMVGLFAIYHLEEKETDFLRNSNFYFDFQKRLEKEYPNGSYTEKYDELLISLVGFRDLVCEIPGVIPQWKNVLLVVESILLLILFPMLLVLFIRLRKKAVQSGISVQSDYLENLTSKEKEILELLILGKSNKEIANEMFIELSTVKSHLSRIYKQLNVAGRKEAIQRARQKI